MGTKNFENELGRSMVEMLGTLAIIGVLSIGGIAGYSYGMDKYRANTIMNDVNLRAIDLIAQVNKGGELSLAEWPTKTVGKYDIGLEKDAETNTTDGGIYVDKVESRVCEILADDLLPEGIELVINGEDYTSGKCGEANKMVFYYDAVSTKSSVSPRRNWNISSALLIRFHSTQVPISSAPRAICPSSKRGNSPSPR